MSRTLIVIPCYNEAARLPVETFRGFIETDPEIDFLFVDDGSRDETGEVITALAAERPGRFHALRLEQNGGKAEAVRRGINHGMGLGHAYIGFFDADLATPLEELPPMRDLLEGRPELEIIFGARVNLLGRKIRRNLLRHYLGRVFATFAVLVVGVPIYDTQCGAKLFRVNQTTRDLFEEPFLSRWIFDVELIARLVRDRRGTEQPGPREIICEYPLHTWTDVAGSKLRRSDFFVVGIDLMRIYFTYMRGGPVRTTHAEPREASTSDPAS